MVATNSSPGLLAIACDSRRALTRRGQGGSALGLWDLGTGHLVREFEGHELAISAAAVTADGKLGLTASRDDTVRLWVLDGGWAQARVALKEGASAVVFFPDGRSFLVGTRRGPVLRYRVSER